MNATKLTKEEKGVLADLQAEVYRVTSNGTRGFSNVRRGLQDIIEGKFPFSSVNPYVANVEQQLNTWQALGVTIDAETRESILQQADVFTPVTDSDEPLVTGGFGYTNPKVVANKLFGAFKPPNGCTKVNYIEDAELRYAPGMKPTGGLRLVHFDPNAYAGLSPESALKAAKQDKLRLAGIEVLEYLMLNSKSGLTWDGKLHYYPNLSGLQQKYNGIWSGVPCLHFWRDDRQFGLYVRGAGYASGYWSSPVVREC
jgi:hypothetical protein